MVWLELKPLKWFVKSYVQCKMKRLHLTKKPLKCTLNISSSNWIKIDIHRHHLHTDDRVEIVYASTSSLALYHIEPSQIYRRGGAEFRLFLISENDSHVCHPVKGSGDEKADYAKK